jgi:hypothetical protein
MEMAHLTGGQQQAVAIAKANDVVSATAGQIDNFIPAMRSANPQLILLLYINGTMSLPSEQPLPAGDYLTKNGQHCYHGSNASMDPLNADWQANRIGRAQQSGAYDGVFLDVMGPAPASPGYMSCLPTDPRTGAPYQQNQFVRDTASLAQAVAGAIPGKMVVSNGLDSGPAFFGIPTTPLEQVGSGAVGEGWMRSAGSPMSWYPSTTQWLQDIHMLQAAGSQQMYVIVKTWVGGDPAQWHAFSLASYLMGCGPGTAYEFSPANSTQGIDGDSAMDHINLGSPVGSMQQTGGGFERAFSAGVALVNPSSSVVTFTLPAGTTYTDSSGNQQSGTVTLPANTGDLLARQS